jgi:hypothetical protein
LPDPAKDKRPLTVGDLEEASPCSPVFDPDCDAHWERIAEVREDRRAREANEAELRRFEP